MFGERLLDVALVVVPAAVAARVPVPVMAPALVLDLVLLASARVADAEVLLARDRVPAVFVCVAAAFVRLPAEFACVPGLNARVPLMFVRAGVAEWDIRGALNDIWPPEKWGARGAWPAAWPPWPPCPPWASASGVATGPIASDASKSPRIVLDRVIMGKPQTGAMPWQPRLLDGARILYLTLEWSIGVADRDCSPSRIVKKKARSWLVGGLDEFQWRVDHQVGTRSSMLLAKPESSRSSEKMTRRERESREERQRQTHEPARRQTCPTFGSVTGTTATGICAGGFVCGCRRFVAHD